MIEFGSPNLSTAWPQFVGKRALLIGGEVREDSRKKLETAFRFGQLDWIGTEFKRNNLQRAKQRIQSGTVDLVLILRRFIGHDAGEVLVPAAKAAAIPFVYVPAGYGPEQVAQAMERYLGRAGGRRP